MAVISLDYDGTYTRDPALWDDFIQKAKSEGHKVICITMRRPQIEAIQMPCEVFYTSRMAKQKFAIENNLSIDIWIDNMPFSIFAGIADNI